MATNSKAYNAKVYHKYWGRPEEVMRRSDRNKARRKKGLSVWDPREVDHKNWNARDNSTGNLRVISRKTNRVLWAKKANMKK